MFVRGAQNLGSSALIKSVFMTSFLKAELQSLGSGEGLFLGLALTLGFLFFSEQGLDSTVLLASLKIFLAVIELLGVRVLCQFDSEVDFLVKAHVGVRDEVALERELTLSTDSLFVDHVDGTIVRHVVFVLLNLLGLISSELFGVHEHLLAGLGINHEDVPRVLLEVGEVSGVDVALSFINVEVIVLDSELSLKIIGCSAFLFSNSSNDLAILI